MAITIKLEIGGAPELQRAFDALKKSHMSKVMRGASKKAIAPVVKDMKSLAPRETGLLRKSIGVKQKTYSNSGTVVTVVGPRKKWKRAVKVTRVIDGKKFKYTERRNPAVYAHLVEGGTRPHSLGKDTSLGKVSREYKALTDRGRAWKKRRMTKAIARHQRGAIHPGTKAQPFMEPAYERNKFKMQRIYREQLWVEIKKIAERNAARRKAA